MKTKSQYLTIHKTRFAASQSLLIETIFHPHGTASGTFKRRKHDVIFYAPDGKPFAALVRLDKAFPFFVNCSAPASNGGKLWFSPALGDREAQALGIHGLTRREEEAVIASILVQLGAGNQHPASLAV